MFGKPTIINNVETFSAIPFIALEGGDKWGAAQGASGEKGIKLYGLCGDVKPTIVENTVGVPFSKVLSTAGASDVKFAECGGATERILLSSEFNSINLGFK